MKHKKALPLTIFVKVSILDIWQGSEYASVAYFPLRYYKLERLLRGYDTIAVRIVLRTFS